MRYYEVLQQPIPFVRNGFSHNGTNSTGQFAIIKKVTCTSHYQNLFFRDLESQLRRGWDTWITKLQ